jgi:tripartite-type tricarboxylate transporter receptor subunit TctC
LALAGDTVIGWIYKLDFNFSRDIVPIASIGGIPLAMVVTPSLPVSTIPEFIAYAKVHPDNILMGSSGIGSLPHVLGEMFAMMAGINLVHVPYRDSVFPDLLSGRVQMVIEPVPAVVAFIKAGKLRPLGVSSKQRIAVLPDVPTIAEFLPGYEGSGWIGVGAPAHTPPYVIETLDHAVTAGLSDPKVKTQLLGLGVIPDPMTTEQFKAYIAAETDKWGKVVKFAHIKMQ